MPAFPVSVLDLAPSGTLRTIDNLEMAADLENLYKYLVKRGMLRQMHGDDGVGVEARLLRFAIDIDLQADLQRGPPSRPLLVGTCALVVASCQAFQWRKRRLSITRASSGENTPSSRTMVARRRSALSCRIVSRNSDRDVNSRYGSSTPRVVRSSARTPIYDVSRPRTSGSLPCVASAALYPAMTPCPAASSYPVVPLI